MTTRYTSVLESKRLYQRHRVSRLFQPCNVLPKNAVLSKKIEVSSISQKLLADNGVLRARSNGMYAILPLGQRVLNKLTNLIDEEMCAINGQRLTLPLLTDGHLWKKTGRWDSTGDELLKVQDRHRKDYVLSPTHEEAVTGMMSEMKSITYRQLPLRLYQITSKFRDEMKPRFGLLRCKEFVMKDLYTFDSSEEEAAITYSEVCNAYSRIFTRLNIPFLKVSGDCGNIGGSMSHEYHFPSKIGEDTLILCQQCSMASNAELIKEHISQCPSCGGPIEKVMGIEVGHTFLLGQKYSEPLNATYQDVGLKPAFMQMGCYGLGITRIMAAAVEVLSLEDQIRWPWIIAPFRVCIITPKHGSKESSSEIWVNYLEEQVNGLPSLYNNVIVDDRNTLTIGRRVIEAKKIGYPVIIIVGKRACEIIPKFEVINNIDNDINFLTQAEMLIYLQVLSNQKEPLNNQLYKYK